ncbi:TolC family protein [Puteibacter caeruleilacunae]|nr:TolC family protein [Puteibacter caeruleilacunae]
MRFYILSLLIVLGGGIKEVSGQTLDLEEYLNLVRKENIQLKQSATNVQISKEQSKEARAGLLPSLGANMGYKRDFTKSYMYLNEGGAGAEGLPNKFRTNYNNNVTANLVAEQPLYAPLASANYKLSKLASQAAELQDQDLQKELIHQGTLLFMQAIYAKESIGVLQENSALAKDQMEKMKSLYEEGFVSEIQMRKSELYYKRTKPILQEAENSYATILNNMKQLAGLSGEESIELKGEIACERPSLDALMNYDQSLSLNSKIKLLNKQQEMAKQKVELSKAAWYPSIKTTLGYAYTADDDKWKFKQDNNVVYGQLQVQIPIISGGANSAKLRAAKLERENAIHEMVNSRMKLNKEVDNARLNMSYAQKKIEEEKELIDLSEKEIYVANEQIKLGAITPLEFKEIRLELTKARLGLLNAYLDLHIAQLTIKKILE